LEAVAKMEIPIPPVFYVLVGIFITAAAQIFLKMGSSVEAFKGRWVLYLVLSLTCYFLSFVSYYLALRYFDISKISPIMMAGIVSLVAFYGFWAGETFSFLRLLGILLGILSIILIYKS
jgi:drug/metabolite transporter (DMT)-like permease